MKVYNLLWLLFFVAILPLLMESCYQAPEFPVTPSIGFESVDFRRGENLDTLIIRVRFQDGDGDLGLGGEENDPPYHSLNFYPSPDGDPCRFSERFDEGCNNRLPAEFSCVYYEYFETLGQDTIDDILYREINENANNFMVDLMIKESGQFEVFDFREELCVSALSGRFPRLKENYNTDGPLEGVIEFKPPSSAYMALFRNDTIKLRMRIKDRALHESNMVESCEFTLNELLELPDGECPPR